MRHASYRCGTLLISLAILSLSSVSAGAQPDCFGPSLTSEYTAGEMHLQFTLWNTGGGFYTTNCWTGVTGVHVYRRTVGEQCGPEVLVTTDPLPWNHDAPFIEPFVDAELVDTGVEPNMAYQYIARAVGAPGNDDAVIGYVSTGPALICRGTLRQSPDCGISMLSWVIPCFTDCFGFAYLGFYPPEATPFFNTNTTLLIYGEFDGALAGICNASFPLMNITSVQEAPCVLGVSSATWGAVKALYR